MRSLIVLPASHNKPPSGEFSILFNAVFKASCVSIIVLQRFRPFQTDYHSIRPSTVSAEPEVYLLTRKLSFGGSIQIEVEAELFGIGSKITNSFTCKKTLIANYQSK